MIRRAAFALLLLAAIAAPARADFDSMARANAEVFARQLDHPRNVSHIAHR